MANLVEGHERHVDTLKKSRKTWRRGYLPVEKAIKGFEELISTEIDVLKALYKSTGNPLFALLGLSFSLDAEIPVPSWVNNYVQDAVWGLFQEIESSEGKVIGTGAVLSKRFGFDDYKGQGNCFSSFQAQWERFEVLYEMYHRRYKKNDSWEDIEAKLSEKTGRPESTLRKWRNAFSKAWKKI